MLQRKNYKTSARYKSEVKGMAGNSRGLGKWVVCLCTANHEALKRAMRNRGETVIGIPTTDGRREARRRRAE